MANISRRDFLKRIGIGSLALPVLPAVLDDLAAFAAGDPQAKLGLVNPKEAMFYKVLNNKMVQCQLCPRYCTVGPGMRGNCRVRENRKGKYWTMVHSNPCAVHVDPIEKKPFFHVLPQSTSFSLATAGCNLHCKYCQNWEISQIKPEETNNYPLTPDDLVSLAQEYGCRSIAYTYTEPTIFYEFMFDTSVAARKQKLINIYHSNGFINPEPLARLIPYLSAANIDLKGFTDDFYNEISEGWLEPVRTTIQQLKNSGVWVEITNLMIPTKNDDPKTIKAMCQWIKNDVGDEVPVHFTRFIPMYKLADLPPTPVETLERAKKIGDDSGLKFVYIGNVFGHKAESTVCPKCKKVVIQRKGYSVLENNLKDGKCRFCGRKIPGIWA
jgi:pyruvate formate lyase activating enzyme